MDIVEVHDMGFLNVSRREYGILSDSVFAGVHFHFGNHQLYAEIN